MTDLSWLSNTVVTTLGESTAQAALMIALLLAVRGLAGHRIPANIYCFGWLLVLVRLVTPVSPTSPFSIFAWFAADDATVTAFRGPLGPALPEGAFHAVASSGPSALWLLAGALWLGGFALVLAFALRGDFRLRRQIATGQAVGDRRLLTVLNDCRRVTGLARSIRVVEVADWKSPAVMGWLRPVLILPTGLWQRLSISEVRALALHEFAHLRRHDPQLGAFATLVVAIHWFNPLVWMAVRALRQDRETACDRMAMTCLFGSGLDDYGRALLGILELTSSPTHAPASAAFVFEARHGFERRLRAMSSFSPKAPLATGLGLIAVLALACTTMTSKPGDTLDVADSPGTFLGNMIDLDLQNTDIKDVLRLLAEAGKVNIVANPSVQGKISVKFKNTPWDHALAAIAAGHGYAYRRTGDLIQVGTIAEMASEPTSGDLTRVKFEFVVAIDGRVISRPKIITSLGMAAGLKTSSAQEDEAIWLTVLPTQADAGALTIDLNFSYEKAGRTLQAKAGYHLSWNEPGQFSHMIDDKKLVVTLVPSKV